MEIGRMMNEGESGLEPSTHGKLVCDQGNKKNQWRNMDYLILCIGTIGKLLGEEKIHRGHSLLLTSNQFQIGKDLNVKTGKTKTQQYRYLNKINCHSLNNK